MKTPTPMDQGCSRRNFWRSMLGETAVWQGEMRGIRHVAIREVLELPDDKFMALQFAVSKDSQLEWRDQVLHAIGQDAQANPIDCPMTEGRFLITYTDKLGTLPALIQEFARQTNRGGIDAQQRLVQAAKTLIQARVLVPTSPPE